MMVTTCGGATELSVLGQLTLAAVVPKGAKVVWVVSLPSSVRPVRVLIQAVSGFAAKGRETYVFTSSTSSWRTLVPYLVQRVAVV